MAAAPRGASLGTRLAFQWKRGWNEIPEVMGAGCIGAASFAAIIVGYVFQDPTKLNRRYKREYYVMRSDDPRIEHVRRYPESPEPTKM